MTWLAPEISRALGAPLETASQRLCVECKQPLPKGHRKFCDEDCYQQGRRRVNRERMRELRKAQIRSER